MLFTREILQAIYDRYTHRAFVHPDPLETLYAFDSPLDMEVAGLVAAVLAYGRVEQILKSLEGFFALSGPSPAVWLLDMDRYGLEQAFMNFRHRFAHGPQMTGFLCGVQTVLRQHGSLRAVFALGDRGGDIEEGLQGFVDEILRHAPMDPGHLLPRPSRGSACKRLHLFLRWMVRKDAVDTGLWEDVGAHRLLVPLDVHMHRMALLAEMTDRKSGDIKTAREITRGFARFTPEDPVRYDFALTRAGILEKKEPAAFLAGFIP
ncbi:TIGR02757 family protein [Desulfobotulus sp. H1]|uniref:TIGR02757 family protein n=1 Tax=Desulfobotulus pelophilus TaxID=2823377 RepID=A0ABT3N774_9BACT|nr:TIGR02757 family protein [Desulfobotulus pelophilus]MCW7753016.1 TIGR02757 family protein [Desulfobotulus pelophilus]